MRPDSLVVKIQNAFSLRSALAVANANHPEFSVNLSRAAARSSKDVKTVSPGNALNSLSSAQLSTAPRRLGEVHPDAFSSSRPSPVRQSPCNVSIGGPLSSNLSEMIGDQDQVNENIFCESLSRPLRSVSHVPHETKGSQHNV